MVLFCERTDFMKKFRYISFVAIIFLMGLFSYINANKNEEIEASSNDTIVEVINGNEKGGEVIIAVKEGDNYVDVGKKATVNVGDYIKIYFKNGLNEGYSIYAWGNYADGYMNLIKESSESDEINTKEQLSIKVKKSMTIYVFPKNDSEHVVTYYDTSVVAKRNCIGISIVEDNGRVAKSFSVPKRTGFDFQKWSQPLKNITKDLEVYPVYNATIFSVFRDYCPMFLKGLGVTLLLSVISVFLALFLGCAVCLVRLSKIIPLKFVASAYVEIIRGVPLLLQLLLIYCLLGPTRISLGGFFTTEVISCILTLFINSSAYVSEIFRSGIQAVDKGQMEAGRALGMSNWQVMRKIILPQGIKNSLPSIGNELIMIIKETSLAVSVDASIGELMSVRKNITGATYINLPPYIIVAIIYFIVTFSLSKVVGYIEKRLSARD